MEQRTIGREKVPAYGQHRRILTCRCQDEGVRTMIDLPDDLHEQALAIARQTSRTLSETVADLMRRGLNQGGAGEITPSTVTGLPVVRLGRTVTTEDIRELEPDG